MTYLCFASCRVLYRNLVIVQHDLLEISRLQICCAYQQNDPNCSLLSHLERNQRGWNYNPSDGKYALEIDGSLRSSSPQLKSPHQKKKVPLFRSHRESTNCVVQQAPFAYAKGHFLLQAGVPAHFSWFWHVFFLHEDEEHILLVGLGMIRW